MDIPIQEWYDTWLDEHRGTNLLFANPEKPSLSQVHFVRDILTSAFWSGVEYDSIPYAPPPRNDCKDMVRIVGEHRSKSIRLPVFKMSRNDIGVTMFMRYNYYDWNVSVISSIPISGIDFKGYGGVPSATDRARHPNGLSGGACWGYLFWQGFPVDACFGPNSDDQRRFSLAPRNDYDLYTFTKELIGKFRGVGC